MGAMTAAPLPSHHHLPHVRTVVIRRFVIAVLVAVAIVLLLAGDTGESAVVAIAVFSVTGWTFTHRRRRR